MIPLDILVAIALWCGPTDVGVRSKKDVNDCRKALIECIMEANLAETCIASKEL
jgi:hypothetical protein